MRVEFTRTGGVAGLTLRASLELDEAPEVLEALRLMGTAHAAALRDHYRYELTLVEGEERSTFAFTEVDVSPELWPVVDRLTRAALKQDL